MKVVVKRDEYTIYERRDGRYAVEGIDKKAINGDDKVAILVANELIKALVPAASKEAPEEILEEEVTAEAAEETAEKPAAQDPAGEEAAAAEPAVEEPADDDAEE